MSFTTTIYTTECLWGSSSFSNTTDLKVGRTNSDVYQRGRVRFAAIPSNWIIKSITLKLTRIDDYNSHILQFGVSTGTGFSATLAYSANKTISSGLNTKSIDLTAYAPTIKGFGATWYLHIRHGDGTNSYTEFNGDEDSNSVKPQLVIVYDLGTVWYYNGTAWVECTVWYYNGTEWVQTMPYYNSGGVWALV